MNDEQLKAIRERWNKRTPGKWTWDKDYNALRTDAPNAPRGENAILDAWQSTDFNTQAEVDIRPTDAECIANAPADVAALLEHVETQAERLRKLEDALEAERAERQAYSDGWRKSVELGEYVDSNEWLDLWNDAATSNPHDWNTTLYKEWLRGFITNSRFKTDRWHILRLQGLVAKADWTPFADIVAGVDEDTAHGG